MEVGVDILVDDLQLLAFHKQKPTIRIFILLQLAASKLNRRSQSAANHGKVNAEWLNTIAILRSFWMEYPTMGGSGSVLGIEKLHIMEKIDIQKQVVLRHKKLVVILAILL